MGRVYLIWLSLVGYLPITRTETHFLPCAGLNDIGVNDIGVDDIGVAVFSGRFSITLVCRAVEEDDQPRVRRAPSVS